MPQGDYIELFQKRVGKTGTIQYFEQKRKKKARLEKNEGKLATKLHGIKAKLLNKKRYAEKVQMKKTIKKFNESLQKDKPDPDNSDRPARDGALPAYLLDREEVSRSKILSNTIKQKRKEKAGKWKIPVPKVKPMTEDEMFSVVRSGKRKKKMWKRLINKVTFVGEDFTRKAPKYERFIRPAALRFTKANVTHPELKTTFSLPIIGVKKNPQSKVYTSLGVMTKGTLIEVNVSELGLVTPSGKVIWAKMAQIVNNPENDGCINAVLLV